MEDDLNIYLLIVIVALGIFVFFLNKVLRALQSNDFTQDDVKKTDFYQKSKQMLMQNNKTNKNMHLYDEFCEYINQKILSIKQNADDSVKEHLATFLKELVMVQGQNSNEEKMQKNLFYFLKNLEEYLVQILGESEAMKIKEDFGKKYNELFS